MAADPPSLSACLETFFGSPSPPAGVQKTRGRGCQRASPLRHLLGRRPLDPPKGHSMHFWACVFLPRACLPACLRLAPRAHWPPRLQAAPGSGPVPVPLPRGSSRKAGIRPAVVANPVFWDPAPSRSASRPRRSSLQPGPFASIPGLYPCAATGLHGVFCSLWPPSWPTHRRYGLVATGTAEVGPLVGSQRNPKCPQGRYLSGVYCWHDPYPPCTCLRVSGNRTPDSRLEGRLLNDQANTLRTDRPTRPRIGAKRSLLEWAIRRSGKSVESLSKNIVCCIIHRPSGENGLSDGLRTPPSAHGGGRCAALGGLPGCRAPDQGVNPPRGGRCAAGRAGPVRPAWPPPCPPAASCCTCRPSARSPAVCSPSFWQ